MNSGWHEHRDASGGYGIRIRLQAFARSRRCAEFSVGTSQHIKFDEKEMSFDEAVDVARKARRLLCRGASERSAR